MRILAIADDLTGALETGAKFAGAGFTSVVLTDACRRANADVVVLDTETRHVHPDAAEQAIRSCAGGWTAPLIYKKTDSTLRGNIGAELRALGALYPAARIAYVPAYPAMGRTVRDGRLYIDGVPVHETCFARDALNPVRDSSVRVVAGDGCEIIDGLSQADIERAADRILSERFQIFAGPAAIAEAVAAPIAPRARPTPEWPRIRSCLIVNGSQHERSREQVRRIDAGGGWRLFERPIASGSAPLDVARDTGAMVARLIHDEAPDAVMIFGGDTAYAILAALGRPALRPVAEIVPGVPISSVEGHALHLITKAGGFGDVDLIPNLRAMLNR